MNTSLKRLFAFLLTLALLFGVPASATEPEVTPTPAAGSTTGETVSESTPPEEGTTDGAPSGEAPVEGDTTEEGTTEGTPSGEAPTEEGTTEGTPSGETPTEEGTTEGTPSGETPTEEGTTEGTPSGEAPTEEGTTEDAPPEAPEPEFLARVGLYYGSNTLAAANLLNEVGTGYRFGYFDADQVFHALGYTDATGITVLKAQNLYLKSNGSYTDSKPSSYSGVVGCWHIQLPGSYSDFASAKAVADGYSGGFVAWINGAYYARVGAYESWEAVSAAQTALGVADTTVTGTSSYAVTVVKMSTTDVLFQFDGLESLALAIRPGLDDSVKTQTWFKDYKYFGSFRYERLTGGNMTVVNFVPLEDYIKGVIPYEMSASWPVEALKAQAVCARTYTICNLDKHKKYNFDLCNTTDCQVYYGTGRADENSDRAVDETAGQVAWYGGELATTFYHSSNGGATENSENVWVTAYPYLTGVIDPYEGLVADKISNYYWSYTFTPNELRQKVVNKGYTRCGEIVDLYVSKTTPTGNVYTITFVDDTGETYSFSKENVRNLLGVRSLRYTITKNTAGGETGGPVYSINGSGEVSTTEGLYAIGSGGTQALGADAYVITGSGVTALAPEDTTVDVKPESFTVSGAGWGHQVGMSQWGAYAMAQEGLTYDQILKFYFTGIEINTYENI